MAHIHSVFDSNEHFVIDPVTREITNSLAKKIVVMQFDHNSERFTFEIPKVDGHNMANCDRVEIHYINVDAVDKTLKSTGVYEVNDIQPSPGDNSVAVFSWLLSRNCTKYAGTLSFLIHFACTTDGVEDYAWNTAIFQSITIGNGMNNGAEVVEPFPDILAQWQAQLFSASETAVLNVTTAEANALAAIEAAGEAKKQAVLDSIPDEYEALSALADQNHRNKAGAIVLDAEGESIVVNDASEYPLQNLKVFGKSTQDGTPTPDAPVDIVSPESPFLTVHGKNLIPTRVSNWQYAGLTFTGNSDGTVSVVGTANADEDSTFQVVLKDDPLTLPKGNYLLSGVNGGSEKTYRFLVYKSDWTLLAECSDGSVPFSLEETTDVFCYIWVYRGTTTNKTFHPMIRFASVEDEAFDTYKKQMLSIPHTLPGIPVSSGGNYTDANGQQWICDEVDLARGVYVQRVATKVFDGTEFGWRMHANLHTFMVDWSVADGGWTEGYAKSSHFRYGTGAYSNDVGCFAIDQKGLCYFATGHSTLDEFKEWIAANPVTVVCKLITPIETALTDAEITAFKALHSNKPNTTILNDAGAHMAVSYVADTKTYIDNKIKELMEGVTE